MTEILATYSNNELLIGRKVVRCGQCKFFKEEGRFSPSGDSINALIVGECKYFDAHVTADGFCAWGWSREW